MNDTAYMFTINCFRGVPGSNFASAYINMHKYLQSAIEVNCYFNSIDEEENVPYH